MSYNPCASLNGVEKLKNLRVLYMGNCKVTDRKEMSRLQELPVSETIPLNSHLLRCPPSNFFTALLQKLEEIVFYGNPIMKDIVSKEVHLATS